MSSRTWTVVGAGVLAGAVAVAFPALTVAPAAGDLGGAVMINPPSPRPSSPPPPSAAASQRAEAPVQTAPRQQTAAPRQEPVVVRPAPPRTVVLPAETDTPDTPDSLDSAD